MFTTPRSPSLTRQEAEQRLMDKLPAVAASAIGLPMKVRMDKNFCVQGTIVAVGFGRFDYTGRAVQMVFKVTLECGSAKALR